jgi:hypothetical protein
MGIAACVEMLMYSVGYTQAVSLLTPAPGTSYAEPGLKALSLGGQLTRTWRDLALRERNQLYAFDVKIMEALASSEWAAAFPWRNAELLNACPKHENHNSSPAQQL